MTLSSSRRTRVTSAFLSFHLSNEKRKSQKKFCLFDLLLLIRPTLPGSVVVVAGAGFCFVAHHIRHRVVMVMTHAIVTLLFAFVSVGFFSFSADEKEFVLRPTEKLVNQFRYASHPGGVAEYFLKL